MATYYIRTDGSDTNAGTGSGTGSAWKTIGKALSSGSSVTGGDTVYIAPGTYREAITVGITPASNVNITADPKATQFSGVSAGPVIWSAFNAASNKDDSAPTGTPCNLGTNGNFTFTDFVVHGHNAATNGNCFHTATAANNITWVRCVMFAQASSCCRVSPPNNSGSINWTFNSCVFITNGNAVTILPQATGGSGTYNLNINFNNCNFYGGNNAVIALSSTGTGSVYGGINVYNCNFNGGSYGIFVAGTAWTTTYKVKVRNCLFTRHLTNAITEGGITNFVDEDYNRFIDSASRSIATSGANSKAAGILGIDGGSGLIQGFAKYHPDMPQVADILTGDGTSTGAPSTDIFGYTRPGTPSVGVAEQNAFPSGGLIVHPGTTGGMRG